MVVEKVIENLTKAAVGAAYTALVGTTAYVFVSANKSSKERHNIKMAKLQAEYDEKVKLNESVKKAVEDKKAAEKKDSK